MSSVISSFNPPSPFLIGDETFRVENANRAWSLKKVDNKQLRFEVRTGDPVHESDVTKIVDRSEVNQARHVPPSDMIHLSYDFRIEPGPLNTVNWCIIGQWHAKDTDQDGDGEIEGTTPPARANLLIGDRLQFLGRAGTWSPTLAPPVTCQWISNEAIRRGQWYSVDMKLRFLRGERGRMVVNLGGSRIIDYSGPLGYGVGNRWKFGVYRSRAPETLAVSYRRMELSTG